MSVTETTDAAVRSRIVEQLEDIIVRLKDNVGIVGWGAESGGFVSVQFKNGPHVTISPSRGDLAAAYPQSNG